MATPLDIDLDTFFKEMEGKMSDVTKKDYRVKLNKLQTQIEFDSDEDKLIDFFKGIENPNTRSNKVFVVIRLRRHFGYPVKELEDYREGIKSEIRHHRKETSKEDLESLISYEQLLDELNELHGVQYYMNYLYAKHGLRNQDINAVYLPRAIKLPPLENTLIFNPKAKKPKATLHVVDYKTSGTYGPKKIVITNPRFIEELKSLDLKKGDFLFPTKEGKKATMNYMNVIAGRDSIRNYGEGRIAKILVKHLIDTSQYDKITDLSKTRGTALSTLYTSYNVMDNK